MKEKKSISQYFKDFVPHLKTMKPKHIIILVLEFALFCLMFTLCINFFYNLANNISFLGEKNKTYEILCTIFLFILTLFVLFECVYDLIFRDYVKDENVSKKIVKNGYVITLQEENAKNENASNTTDTSSKD
jgi:Na+/alanine symporter